MEINKEEVAYPQVGKPVYMPSFLTNYQYDVRYWKNDSWFKEMYHLGLMLKTPKEAIELTRKFEKVALNILKEKN